MMRFGTSFWDWSARRVFSPNPHAIVLFSFFVSGHSTDTHTNTENGSLRELKRQQLQGGEREKARSLFDKPKPPVNIYGLSIWGGHFDGGGNRRSDGRE